MHDPTETFTSADRSERLLRAEIAELINSGLEAGRLADVARFSPDDVRLTDEVCYAFVNEYVNNGDPLESTLNLLEEHPEIRIA